MADAVGQKIKAVFGKADGIRSRRSVGGLDAGYQRRDIVISNGLTSTRGGLDCLTVQKVGDGQADNDAENE